MGERLLSLTTSLITPSKKRTKRGSCVAIGNLSYSLLPGKKGGKRNGGSHQPYARERRKKRGGKGERENEVLLANRSSIFSLEKEEEKGRRRMPRLMRSYEISFISLKKGGGRSEGKKIVSHNNQRIIMLQYYIRKEEQGVIDLINESRRFALFLLFHQREGK